MHKPKVLILDEPTSGLDPLMQEAFYEEILSAKKRGAVVLLSSHILGEVQKICDHVGIIKEGKLIKESAVDDLLKSTGQNFVIEFAGKVPISEIKKIKGLSVSETDGNSVSVSVSGKLSELLKFLSEKDLVSLRSKEADLEEVFLGYYESEVK
jgi:ABC-2 type transport system ATP-binding protein